MISSKLILKIIVISLFYITASQADYIFPARLDLKEVSPNTFEVSFNLPIINNMKLKVEAELPDICKSISEKSISSTASYYNEYWQITCNSDELHGKQIKIRGLRGTQIEIMLNITMLNGRIYNSSLKPGRAVYLIPERPSTFSLLLSSLVNGIRESLIRVDLWLIVFILAFVSIPGKHFFLIIFIYLVTFLTGNYLTNQLLLIVNVVKSEVFIFLFITIIALKLRSNQEAGIKLIPLIFLPVAVLGMLNGGTITSLTELTGLSTFEHRFVSFSLGFGIICGILMLYLLARQIQLLTTSYFSRKPKFDPFKITLSCCAFIAITVMWYHLLSFALVPALIPDIPWMLYISAAIMGIWMARNGVNNNIVLVLIMGGFFLAGIIAGLSAISIPFGNLIPLGILLLMATLLIFKTDISYWLQYIIPCIFALSIGWFTAFTNYTNITMPVAHTIEAALDCVLILYTFYSLFRSESSGYLPRTATTIAIIVLLWGIVIRFIEYYYYFYTDILSSFTMGYLLIPVFSLIILIIAIISWPRRRRVLEHLDIQYISNAKHWLLILLAFLIFPFGAIQISNPFAKSGIINPAQVKLVLNQLLYNTYSAFNLTDEDKLYERLAENISGDLIVDVYLNSRRRLSAGVREGSEVKVREVSVVSVGDAILDSNAGESFTIESKWMVTARVRHLQHIHHRQNIYAGIIILKIENNKWKIKDIDLKSEDRVIIPWSSG